MSVRRKVFVIVGVLAGLIAAALILLIMNLDWLVKTAIERYGTQATKTAVRVSSVSIRLTAGEGGISGLTVANPPGFSSPYIFRLGKISTKIDTRTVTKSPVVIDEVRISAPRVFYDMNSSRVSNIDVLKRNIQESAGGAAQKVPEGKKTKGKETKLIIKRLVIESGQIDVNIAALGDSTKTLTLRRIELHNIGGEGGATSSQLAGQMTTALVDEAGRVVQAGFKREIEKEIGRGVKRLLEK